MLENLNGTDYLRDMRKSASKTYVTGVGYEAVSRSQLAHGRLISWALTNTELCTRKNNIQY
jgi:hypothetical protein